MSAGDAGDLTARVDPHMQVVRGAPDDVELAALVAGLAAAAARRTPRSPGTDAHAARARWTAPAGRRGTALPAPGPGVWRWSLHP